MLRGREMMGLPVYTLKEGIFLGRVDHCYLDLNRRRLGGIILERQRFHKKQGYLPHHAILKIYGDGIIVSEKKKLTFAVNLPKGMILYSTFLQYMEMPLKEGRVLTDLFFDADFRIVGGEISAGIWQDMTEGRSFCSWRELLANIEHL